MAAFNYWKSLATVAALCATTLASTVASAVVLPAISKCSFSSGPIDIYCYTTSGGAELYVASRHDDFYSYGVNAINTYVAMGYTELTSFTGGLGSGNILKLFTFNNGDNGTFPDANTGTPTGNGPGSSDFDGVFPVGDVTFSIAQLTSFIGSASTPVFGFDLAEPTSDVGLFLNGSMTIRSASGDLLDRFAFDNIYNSNYDENSVVFAPSALDIFWTDPVGCGVYQTAVANFCSRNINTNVGSGSGDFYAFAYDFDKNDYDDTDVITFRLKMSALNGSGEELFLAQGVQAPRNDVPEPASLALLGLGLLGLAATRRKSM